MANTWISSIILKAVFLSEPLRFRVLESGALLVRNKPGLVPQMRVEVRMVNDLNSKDVLLHWSCIAFQKRLYVVEFRFVVSSNVPMRLRLLDHLHVPEYFFLFVLFIPTLQKKKLFARFEEHFFFPRTLFFTNTNSPRTPISTNTYFRP